MRDVSTLDVPPSRAGARALQQKNLPNSHGTTGRGRQVAYGAYVLSEQSKAEGRLRVAIDGEAKTAYLSPTAKAVQVGDRVVVQKLHGAWYVIENQSWHEPPKAGPTLPTTTPPNAQSPTSVNLRNVSSSITGASGTGGSTLQAWTYTAASRIRDLADAVNALNSQSSSLRSVATNNATRQNQTRDLATSVRDTVGPLREGAIQDRVIRS